MHNGFVNEIGSEFWIDGEPPNREGLPSWLKTHGRVFLFSSGRGAISSVLSRAKENGYRRALLPSYLCEAMVAPFDRTGFKCEYYSLNSQLECDIDDILAECARERSVLLHMGYFGFDTNRNIKAQACSFKELGVLMIEDITHTLFSASSPNGSHCRVASLRKWMGLPSGGAVFCDDEGLVSVKSSEHRALVDIRLKALSLKGRFIKTGDAALKTRCLALFAEGERILDNDVDAYAMDPFSLSVLSSSNGDDIVIKRRSNYELLFDEVSKFKRLRPVFDRLPDHVCPIFFPVFCDAGERNGIKKHMISRDIYCTSHWPMCPKLDGKITDEVRHLYGDMISIPCDQRYDQRDMVRIAGVLKELE